MLLVLARILLPLENRWKWECLSRLREWPEDHPGDCEVQDVGEENRGSRKVGGYRHEGWSAAASKAKLVISNCIW